MKVRDAIEELKRQDPDDELCIEILVAEDYVGIPVDGMHRDTTDLAGKTILETQYNLTHLGKPKQKTHLTNAPEQCTLATSKGNRTMNRDVAWMYSEIRKALKTNERLDVIRWVRSLGLSFQTAKNAVDETIANERWTR